MTLWLLASWGYSKRHLVSGSGRVRSGLPCQQWPFTNLGDLASRDVLHHITKPLPHVVEAVPTEQRPGMLFGTLRHLHELLDLGVYLFEFVWDLIFRNRCSYG